LRYGSFRILKHLLTYSLQPKKHEKKKKTEPVPAAAKPIPAPAPAPAPTPAPIASGGGGNAALQQVYTSLGLPPMPAGWKVDDITEDNLPPGYPPPPPKVSTYQAKKNRLCC